MHLLTLYLPHRFFFLLFPQCCIFSWRVFNIATDCEIFIWYLFIFITIHAKQNATSNMYTLRNTVQWRRWQKRTNSLENYGWKTRQSVQFILWNTENTPMFKNIHHNVQNWLLLDALNLPTCSPQTLLELLARTTLRNVARDNIFYVCDLYFRDILLKTNLKG